jgi:hypothetical protein
LDFANILKFLQFQKERFERKEITAGTVKNYFQAIKLFCDMNDIPIPWKKISKGLARFSQAKLFDCRINAYPYREDWAIELLGQLPNFIFIDEDKSNFNSKKALDMAVRKTLRNIKEKLNNENAEPTVLWSGSGGYHILQPVEALVLGQEK